MSFLGVGSGGGSGRLVSSTEGGHSAEFGLETSIFGGKLGIWWIKGGGGRDGGGMRVGTRGNPTSGDSSSCCGTSLVGLDHGG